jgi:ABC-type glycerol-3-phosphate transport system substrate-binding protein
MRRYKIITLLLIGVFVITSGFGCKGISCNISPESKPVALTYWGVWDAPSQLGGLIGDYQASHPSVKVSYKQLRYDEYERKLLDSWADDRGRDIFAIPVSRLNKYQNRIVPMPATVRIPVQEVKGTLKKETVTTIQTINGLTANQLKNQYVDVVYKNVVRNNQIYALPYSLDTLVTFFNEDLLDQAGLPEKIVTFNDLVDQTSQLTKITSDDKIVQSAVALGGTNNIPRYFDIISSLMLQTQVNLSGNKFNPLGEKQSATRFRDSINFYTSFSRPGLSAYSWDKNLPNAFDMFSSGKLAYFFGYSYHADALRAKGVPFEWGITSFPQTEGSQGTKYYADYWVNVVAKKSRNSDVAWNFVQNTASAQNVKKYLDQNKKPTALRALINEQKNNPDISPFANQVLTADNWYNGYDFPQAEVYMADFINGLIENKIDINNADDLDLFIKRINQTYQQSQ